MQESRRPLVLVADDEQNAVLLLRRILERDGFAVESAKDGISALEKARTLKPDLILLDVQMPRLNGFEVTARLRENPETARIPVIFVTAAAREPSDVAHGLQLGADDYVRKPYDYHELLARATSKMRARQLEDRLQKRSEELEALARIGAQFNEELGLSDLTERILTIAHDEFESDQITLYLFDEQRHLFLCRNSQGIVWNPQESEAYLNEERGSAAARVYQSEEPALLENSEPDSDMTVPNTETHFRSAMAAPLKHHGKLLGILAVEHEEPEYFGENKLRMLRSIGEQAALAVRNAQLYATLQGYAQNLEAMVEARTKELRNMQEKLIQSEKLAALGRLSAGIAHEVNNPLQPILNCLEVAIEDLDNNVPVDPEGLRVAEMEVQRIKSIVSRLLDFARPTAGEKIQVDLPVLVKEVLVLLNKQTERAHVQIEARLNPVPLLDGNPVQLKQVILNLLLNAFEAMPDGGQISIETRPSGDNEGVYLIVNDTGHGMGGEIMARIFEPFYSTKEQGTGLGLAVTYGIIQGHGGEIKVESEENEGSRFIIWLPLSSQQAV